MTTPITYRFVAPGTVAPETVPPGEIWLDVGSRCAPGVLDHHGGDTSAHCAAELVLKQHDALVTPSPKQNAPRTLVLHHDPDLDAICSAWLMRSLLGGRLPEPTDAVQRIVRAVGENDQGLVRTDDPSRCWPVVFRSLLNIECCGMSDEARLNSGFHALDTTLAELAAGGNLESASTQIATPLVHTELTQAQRDYLDDVSRGIIFQVCLPHRTMTDKEISADRRVLTDALLLKSPRSSLFKELARGDTRNSHLGQGFALLIVSRPVKTLEDGRSLHRHILSTDPFSGVTLEGLGAALEAREKQKEDEASLPLLLGRERLEAGKGRHGYGVASPWYDGRGHGYTIIDCPNLAIGGSTMIASFLLPDEILDAVWAYGDPAAFTSVAERELTLLEPVEFQAGWADTWSRAVPLSRLCPDLCGEVLHSVDAEADGTLYIYERPDADANETILEGFRVFEQRLWVFDGRSAIWTARCERWDAPTSVRGLCEEITEARVLDLCGVAADSLRFSYRSQAAHIAICRVNPDDFNCSDASGHHARMHYRMAIACPASFGFRIVIGDALEAQRVLSRDRQFSLLASDRGLAVVSTRAVSLANEADFHLPSRLCALVSLVFGQRAALDRMTERPLPNTARSTACAGQAA